MKAGWFLRLLAVVSVVLYLGLLAAFAAAFSDDVPAGAWVGFGFVAAVATALLVGAIVFFERIDTTAGMSDAGRAGLVNDGRQRLLVVADVGCSGNDACPHVLSAIRDRSNAKVFVVAPTIASRFHHLMDDEGREHTAAGRRLDEVISLLRREDVEARGMIGSDLPLEAIQDALAVFPADEILILAPPADTSAWSERDLVERTRITFGGPVAFLPVT